MKRILGILLLSFLAFISLSSCAKTKMDGVINHKYDLKYTSIRPNIILIVADDIGYENISCDGGESYQTPNLDTLAYLGTRFTQCHSCPLCSPSRVEIMTGKYNYRNYSQWGYLSDTNRTFGNVLHDAGYRTGVFGKWQLDGAGKSANKFGFDEYLLFNPKRIKKDPDELGGGSRYKNPVIYGKGGYFPDSLMLGKYGEDVFTDSIIKFMAKGSSFFVYYPMVLCHPPFSPTPDDPEFEAWDSKAADSYKRFYPSMMKYMDKCIGRLVHAVDSMGLGSNTIIIFTGDNGTARAIYSLYNGVDVKGGKGTTLETGTHVPLLVRWLWHIPARVDNTLIDFTDFLPTLAALGGAKAGITDGLSFFPQILGVDYGARDWIFCQYNKNPKDTSFKTVRWIQTGDRKLYDSTFLYYDYLRSEADTIPQDSTYNYLKTSMETLR